MALKRNSPKENWFRIFLAVIFIVSAFGLITEKYTRVFFVVAALLLLIRAYVGFIEIKLKKKAGKIK